MSSRWKKATLTIGHALEDPNVHAVVVVTPTALHHDVVIQAARAGKHVLCEKPMAMDVGGMR